MSEVVYRIVEHDGGWAYKLGDVYSETFASRSVAEAAAEWAAAEQRTPGDDEAISWQDEDGRWHDELGRGDDRPQAYVARKTDGGAWDAPIPDEPPRPMIDEQRGARRRDGAFARRGLSVPRGQPLAAVLLAGLCGYGLALLLDRRK